MASSELVEIILSPELQSLFLKSNADRLNNSLPNTYLSPGQLGQNNPFVNYESPYYRFDIDIREDEYPLPYRPTSSFFNQLDSRVQYTETRGFQPTFYYNQRPPIDQYTAMFGPAKADVVRSNYYTNYIAIYIQAIMDRFYETEGYEQFLATLQQQRPTIGVPVATPIDPNYRPGITDTPVRISPEYYNSVIAGGGRLNVSKGAYLTFGVPANIGSFTFADNTLNNSNPQRERRLRNVSTRNRYKASVGQLEVFGSYRPYYEYIQRVKYTPDGTPFIPNEETEIIDFFDETGAEIDPEALAEEQGLTVEELIEQANQDADNTNDIEERINEEAEIATLTRSVIFNNTKKFYYNTRSAFNTINGAMSGYITSRDLRIIASLDREEFRASLTVYRPLLGYEVLASASNIPGISYNDINPIRPSSLKKDPNLTLKPSYNSWYGYNDFYN